jgi:alanyl-tRNA synthetase
VDRDWLRFDFANPRPLSRDDLRAIEAEVNARVASAEPIRWTTMPIAEARKLGAMMLFGEKYPDEVRVVSMGEFSKELCGGTHLTNTGQAGLFKIIGEESVAAGTRRITALTGPAALDRVQEQERALAEVAAVLKAPVNEVSARVEALVKEARELKKHSARAAGGGEISAEKLLADAEDISGAKVIVAEVAGGTPPVLRQLIDQVRRKGVPTAALLASREDDKVVLIAGISRDLEAKGVHAGQWVRSAAEIVGGSGGGRPDMAQAGGKDPQKLSAALDKARQAIHEQLAHAG